MSDVFDRLRAALADRYAIEREIGAGGMATVYLARDLKHDRWVALKVLRPELAAVVGAERFLTEIKVTASLQHPNLLPLFDSGEADGQLFYVMPYVEGESLRKRILREKQLPIPDALHIATSVASALDYAHRQGVIHRDLKPENILLRDGEPLVADFGIALAVSNAGGDRVTQTGLSLGTPQYMSPEQATGDRAVDGRSDVYSLAAVTYEMLSGEPPHTGTNAAAIIARLLTEPHRPVRSMRPSVSELVERSLEKGLEKLPADRFTTAREFSDALSGKVALPRQTNPLAGRKGMWSSPGDAVIRIALVLVGLLLGVSGILWANRTPADRGEAALTSVFPISLPEDARVKIASGVNVALSPDGRRIAYVGPSQVNPASWQLWLRPLDQMIPQPIPGTDLAHNPAFSPDGSSIAFTTGIGGDASLRVVSLGGGPVTTVLSEGVPSGGGGVSTGLDWANDGYLYFTNPEGGLTRVAATGGQPEPLTRADAKTRHQHADVLPNGKGILFQIRSDVADTAVNQIALWTPDGRVTPLFAGRMARYAPSGHIVYSSATDATLEAVPFDQDKLVVTGKPVTVIQGASYLQNASQFAISSSGSLTYVSEGTDLYELVRVARDGSAIPIDPGWRAGFTSLALSPDGRRLAVSIISGPRTDIWIKELDRGPLAKITFEGARNYRPVWVSNDSLFFTSNRKGQEDAWLARSDGTGTAELILDREAPVHRAERSPDGKWLVYQYHRDASDDDILAAPMDRLADSFAIAATKPYHESEHAISPDGRFIAYASGESGRNEIYVRPFPDVAKGKWLISNAGGTQPTWSRDGRELFYLDGVQRLVSVTVDRSPEFRASTPRVLFSAADYLSTDVQAAFAVMPDGQHFIMARKLDVVTQELVLVQNFFQDLAAKVTK